MVKILCLVIALFVGFGSDACAQRRNAAEMSGIARAAMHAEGKMILSSELLGREHLRGDKEAFHVYTQGDERNGSFVIVPNDERLGRVLGYSDTRGFDAQNMPANLKAWLEECASAAEMVEKGQLRPVLRRVGSKRARALATSVEPLLTSQWDQFDPYNGHCPEIGGERTVTGCVATAMAQVMYLHKSPAVGSGKIAYTTASNGIRIDDNLSNYPLDWAHMKDTYSPGSYTQTEADAVANLMYACGISVGMDYGVASQGGSGSALEYILTAANKYFGYDDDGVYMDRSKMDPEAYSHKLMEELCAGRPVLYRGSTSHGGGHAFVLDGYRTTGDDVFYHVNWGWSGSCDGYYQLLDLTPGEPGVGGTADTYAFGQGALLNFMPDNASVDCHGFLQAEYVSVSPNMLSASNRQITVSLQNVFNSALRTFKGDILVYLVDDADHRTLLETCTTSALGFGVGYSYLDIGAVLPESVENGTYHIEVVTRDSDTMGETPVYCAYSSLDITLSSSPVSYEPDVQTTLLNVVAENDGTIKASAHNVLNLAQMSFIGTLQMALADTDGTIKTLFGNKVQVPELKYLEYDNEPFEMTGRIPTDIADGEYRLYVVAAQQGCLGYGVVHGYTIQNNNIVEQDKECYVGLTITNGNVVVEQQELPETAADIEVLQFDLLSTDGRYVQAEVGYPANLGDEYFSGDLSLAYKTADGDVVAIGNPFLTLTLGRFQMDQAVVQCDAVLPLLPNGDYELCVAARQTGYSNWNEVTKYSLISNTIVEAEVPCTYSFHVIDGAVTFGNLLDGTVIAPANVTLADGEQKQLRLLSADGKPVSAYFLWKSDDANIASVTSDGWVLGLAPGTTTVRACSASGETYATCEVVVENAADFAEYDYYMLEISEICGGTTIQMGEVELVTLDGTKDDSFEVYAGTNGTYAGQGWQKLTDGNTRTKYCNVNFDGSNRFFFKTDAPVAARGYRIYTGDDTRFYPGRNPRSWTLYGSNTRSTNANDPCWTLIAEVTNDTIMQPVNEKPFYFPITPSQAEDPLPEKYLLTYLLDDVVYHTDSVEVGTELTHLDAPTKEGYTFSGWSEIPATMPASDVTITGSFSINSYKLTYIVDGEVYNELTVAYGAAITPLEALTKEGYTFSDWSEIPATMPASDVTVTGTFSINSYKLTYIVDGEAYNESTVEYGAAITPFEAPTKEGFTFSGWSEIPETMPASDVTVTGSYVVNTYYVIYKVGDDEVYRQEVAYGEAIPTFEYVPEDERYTFVGWVGEQYDTMPAHDVMYVADVADGISANVALTVHVVHTLQGVKVGNVTNIRTLPKGMYIIDGKKVLLR